MEKTCLCCKTRFIPHPAVRDKGYCSNLECQKERKRNWQKEKLARDSDYRATINNPDIMPDHIGAELNFLALLFDKSDTEPRKKLYYLSRAKDFWEEHLSQWVPLFTRDMEEAAELSFYKTLARVTRDIITTR